MSVISRCFAEDGMEKYEVLKITDRAIPLNYEI